MLLLLGVMSTEGYAALPDSSLQKAKAFFEAGNYDSAAVFYRRSGSLAVDERYDAACAFAQSGATEDAVAMLRTLCDQNGYTLYPHLLLETKFLSLHDHSDWPALVNSSHNTRNRTDPAQEAALRERLDTIFMQDQLPRIELNAALARLGPMNPELQHLGRRMARADSQTLTFVIPLLNKRGWLPPSKIGRSGVRAVFMVLQHADTAVQLHWLPALRAAAARDEIPAADMALFEDRTALRSGRKQLFGTQVFADGKDGVWMLEPLEDPLHVDERRHRAGLEPLAEYLRAWNILWDAAAYEKEQKAQKAE